MTTDLASAAAGTAALAGEWRAGPTAPRMILGAQLRRLREARSITREAAADVIRGSESKISRMELGRHKFKPRDLEDLLELYGVVEEADRAVLLELGRQSGLPGWWQPYSDLVPLWFEPCLGLEQAASVIRGYEIRAVHDLLQTPDYARAELARRHQGETRERLARRLELRLHRQEVLTRPGGARLWVVLDEAALRRPAGGRALMRAQFDHLVELSSRPNVRIQILPFSHGVHAASGTPITLLRLPAGDLPDVVFLERHNDGTYPDRAVDVLRYRQLVDEIGTYALRPEQTPQFLDRVLRDL
ncbi:helix-turn-helix domain-containing protein [Actinocorallia populi]|uniref:helix-turn-helix domain-containing protein n=1 Tax=Actinocorallia populi TaxID=2079200 RepID=UPI000D08B5F0|nr:helix-turn-helix transcriptional regulator [Actinocorallia populi]